MPISADDLNTDEKKNMKRSALLDAIHPIMNEALVAQRLLTIGLNGLNLVEGDGTQTPIQSLSSGLATSVASLLPPLSSQLDSKERRTRRKWQESLLRQQKNWPDMASVNSSAFLLCADHRPSEYGLPDQLYINHQLDGLATWKDFETLLSQVMKTVSPVLSPAWVSSQMALREALVTLVWETFKNTHDHARHEVNGAEVETSIRALYAHFYPVEEIANHRDSEGAASPAEHYLKSFSTRVVPKGVRTQPAPAVTGILEISIMDSGPGMAAKWLGRSVDDASPQEQYEAILQCFQKGKTTTGGIGRGFGLAKVLTSIDALKGLISVRTNGIHVYRQFRTSAGVGWEEQLDGTRSPKEQLFDWRKGWSPTPSKFENTRGTVVSFLIPMGAA